MQQHFGVQPTRQATKPEAFPGYLAPIIRLAEDGSQEMECVAACFGLVPSWADMKLAKHTYNARTETVGEKPSFRSAFRKRQFCIIPADAIFEPSYETGRAVRWKITDIDDRPLAIAGIWDWRPNGGLDDQPLVSFSMLTINADDHPLMQRFHKPNDEKRMLVMLEPDAYTSWLHADAESVRSFFTPYPAEQLDAVTAPRAPALRKASAKPENLRLL